MCFSGPTTRRRCERMHSHDDGWTRADGRHGNANSTARHDLHGTSCKGHGHTGMSWIYGQKAHCVVRWHWRQCESVWICCQKAHCVVRWHWWQCETVWICGQKAHFVVRWHWRQCETVWICGQKAHFVVRWHWRQCETVWICCSHSV